MGHRTYRVKQAGPASGRTPGSAGKSPVGKSISPSAMKWPESGTVQSVSGRAGFIVVLPWAPNLVRLPSGQRSDRVRHRGRTLTRFGLKSPRKYLPIRHEVARVEHRAIRVRGRAGIYRVLPIRAPNLVRRPPGQRSDRVRHRGRTPDPVRL